MHITDKALSEYLQKYYKNQILISEGEIVGFPALLQNNYGGANDCTLTCITAILYYISNKNHRTVDIYNHVEEVANKNLYKPNTGTVSAAIRTIFNQSARRYTEKTSCCKYTKGVGFNYNFFKKEIDNKNPVILSMRTDGFGYYKNHSVTVIGYKEYNGAKLLKIYDNWTLLPSYIDYNKLGTISTAHCLCSKSYPFLDFLWDIIISLFGLKK
jgi:hypothetical protein